MTSADHGADFSKGLNGLSIPEVHRSGMLLGKSWRQEPWASGKKALGCVVMVQSCLSSCHPPPAASLKKPSLASWLPELPPQRRGRVFLGDNEGAWVNTAPLAASTAGWQKSYWMCPNYSVMLQAINFPSSTCRDFIDEPFLCLWCSLGVSFCVLFPGWGPDQALWY